MLFNLIKNLYVPFGIPFDPKRYYKDGDSTRYYGGQDMALPPRDQRHKYLRYKGLQYTDADIVDFETRLARIYRREVHKVQVFNFEGLPDLMVKGLRGRMLIEHRDAQGQSMFTSRAWRRLFEIRGPLVHELIMKFFGTFRFGEAMLDLDTAGALQFQLGGVRRLGDFLGTPPSYTLIKDPMLRLCHRLITCSIAGRSQAPKKVIVTDLFYLRRMDVDLINVPYLLARYLRLFASGRNHEAMIFGGQYVARFTEHFGLLIEERLQGLTVIVRELLVTDMAELATAAGAPKAVEDAPAVDEGAQADPTPMQAP
ncbi:hypothetical protein Tco_1195317 [Tanacetum coccineum]